MNWLLQYLLNAVWQVPLFALAGLAAARLLRACGPAVEHRVWVLVLGAEVALPACSFNPLPWLQTFLSLGQTAPPPAGAVTLGMGPGLKVGLGLLPPWLFATLTAGYMLLTLYFALKLLLGLRQTRVLLRSATPVALSPQTELFLAQCKRHFHVDRVAILTSPEALGPLTLGIRHPVILLPVGMLAEMTAAELETVLAHEFAHIGRHDYAKNLAYEAFALPLRLHPVVWLTRSRIVESREILCDRLAAALLRSPQVYARSLVRLAALLIHRQPVRVAHAIGIFDAHSFERRVMQLTRVSSPATRLRAGVLLGAATLFGLGTCASALSLRATLQPPAAPAGTGSGASQNGALSVSAGVMAGNILTKSVPVYPVEAKKAGIEGSVVLHAIIGKEGTVENLTVLSGPPELTGSALDAVSKWVYKPFLLNGEPTEVETTITVNYSLAR